MYTNTKHILPSTRSQTSPIPYTHTHKCTYQIHVSSSHIHDIISIQWEYTCVQLGPSRKRFTQTLHNQLHSLGNSNDIHDQPPCNSSERKLSYCCETRTEEGQECVEFEESCHETNSSNLPPVRKVGTHRHWHTVCAIESSPVVASLNPAMCLLGQDVGVHAYQTGHTWTCDTRVASGIVRVHSVLTKELGKAKEVIQHTTLALNPFSHSPALCSPSSSPQHKLHFQDKAHSYDTANYSRISTTVLLHTCIHSIPVQDHPTLEFPQ